jgi:uncharacterized protein (TIGR00725 family)
VEPSTHERAGLRGSGRVTYVAVVGPGDGATQEQVEIARQVGSLLAEKNAVVVCGGLGGVMAAACQGAAARAGLTVGLLPGRDRAAAAQAGNRHLSVVLPTGLGELRNGLVVNAADAVIAIGGSWGTLSEIALAMRTGKPTIVLGSWTVDSPAQLASAPWPATSPEDAVEQALSRCGR